MPSALHEGLIRAAAARYPGMRINGFARDVRAAVAAGLEDGDADDAAEYVAGAVTLARRPDAHVIDSRAA